MRWFQPLLANNISTDIHEWYNRYSNRCFNYKEYSSHTQAVERSIRLISQTTTMFCIHDDSDARIRNYLAANKIMPDTFDSK